MPTDGLDDLERRGRWAGRPRPQGAPERPTAPVEPAPIDPPAPPRPARRRAAAKAPPASKARVERVVVYLSQAQTEWLREQQIEALRKRKRVSASQLIRDLLDRALAQRKGS
jgi:hypothetical protein